MALFAPVLALIFVPESPLWQLKMGRLNGAKETLSRVMRMNEATGWEDDIANLEKKIKQLEA